MKTMNDLNISIDALIDDLFAEPVEKSMIKDANPAKETADEATKQAPKSEKDEARGEGRPKQISDVPQTDEDGKRSGEYDGTIAAPQADAKKKEDSQVEAPEHMKKSVTDAEWEEYQALKKAKTDKEAAETLQKARKEQADLIKSAVTEAIASVKTENEDLRKALKEQGELIKAMANKPQKSKAVTNVNAVEKFEKSRSVDTFSKAELLDIAEDLYKSKKLDMEHVIELDNNGFIFDDQARALVEREAAKRQR
jgi:hypothetical protein